MTRKIGKLDDVSRGQQQGGRLASAVRYTRLRRGWTRETLAHKTGLSWAAITQIETGRRTEVRLSSLDALARALDVSLDYLVRGDVAPTMLDHRALLFGSEDELATLIEPVLRAAVAAEHAALVVTTPINVAAIKKQLGADGKRVHFRDGQGWYESPVAATAKYEAFTRSALSDGAPWVELVGEVIGTDGRRAKTSSWMRYESLFNALFAAWPVNVTCVYDARSLSRQAFADVERTHPEIVSRDGVRDSTSYEDPMKFVTV